jgi:K+-transporting ATPase ATPase B chain
MSTKLAAASLLDGSILRDAVWDCLVKLNPRQLVRNPVIFVTAVVALLASVMCVRDGWHSNINGRLGHMRLGRR